MNWKNKGINAEREIVKMFWLKGWACFRSAGSGSMRFPGPDIIAGNKIRKVAVECKTCSGLSVYLGNDDFQQLVEFSKIFGAEPWFAIKFDKIDWFFISPEDLLKTGNGFKIDIITAKRKGVCLEEFMN